MPIVATGVVRHQAPRLPDQQRPRRDIPGGQLCSQNPSNLPAATSARSSEAAPGRRMPLATLRHAAGIGRRYCSIPLDILEWKAGADERERRIANRGHREPPLAVPGAAAARRGVGIPGRHIDDRRRLQHSVHRRGDGYRIAREIVQEVGGAVERIHDPDHPSGHDFRLQFLADDAAAGLRRQQAPRSMIRSAVRSTSVTKSRLPFSVHRLVSAGRSTPLQVPGRPLRGGSGQVQ